MKRVEGVDITRGLLALSVAIYHYIQFLDISWLKKFHPIISAGLTSVDGFFMISGFALFYSYHQMDFLNPQNTGQYFLKRFARIAPLFYLCMLLNTISPSLILLSLFLIFLSGSIGNKTVTNFWIKIPFVTILLILLAILVNPFTGNYNRLLIINNLSFLFGFVNPNLTSVRGGWSIGIEYVFYFILPFILCLSRSNIKLIFGITIISCIVAVNYQFLNDTNLFSYNSTEHPQELITNWPLYTNPLNHFYFFMAGMMLFIIYDRWYFQISSKQSLLIKLLIILLCFYGVADHFVGNPSHGKGRLIYSLITIAIVAITPFIKMKEHWLKKQLVVLGDISYSVYLMQFPVFTLVMHYSKSWSLPLIEQLILTLFCLIIIAYLTYKLYEIPTKKWLTGIKLFSWKNPFPQLLKIRG